MSKYLLVAILIITLYPTKGNAQSQSINIRDSIKKDGVHFSNTTISDIVRENDTKFFATHSNIEDFECVNSEFTKFANFSNLSFTKKSDFSFSQFDGIANFDQTTYFEYCNFRNINFRDVASFQFATFNGYSSFDLATFNNNTYFQKTHFYKDASFAGARFFNDVNFEGSIFENAARFNNAYFDSAALFRELRVKGEGDFYRSFYNCWAYFSFSNFYKSTGFSLSVFSQHVSFQADSFFDFVFFDKVIFDTAATFTDIHFDSTLVISNSICNGIVDFSETHFANKAKFSNLTLNKNGNIYFKGTVLPDTIDFSFNYKIPEEIDFTAANFSDTVRYIDKSDGNFKPHLILLIGSDISKIHLDYIHFRLLLPDSIYDPNKKSTIRIMDDERETIYESLLNNFRIRGQQESYKLLDIEYQKFKWNHSWGRYFVWLPLYWWNFGYDKQYVFKWTFYFLGIFTLISFCFLDYLNSKVYSMQNIPRQGKIRGKKAGQFIYVLLKRYWYSLIYTSNIFFKITLKFDDMRYNKFWGTAYVMIVYTLGLICLAYMANFILQK